MSWSTPRYDTARLFLRRPGAGYNMRILLQTPQAPGGRPRFCMLSLQRDLLEGWTMTRETGYQGYAGQIKRVRFGSLDAAVEAMSKARDSFVKRGYRTVFSEGQAAPGAV